MNHRQYAVDDSIRERADRFQRIRDADNIPQFATALLEVDYVVDNSIPDYETVLNTFETVRATLSVALDTTPTETDIRTRLETQATSLSSLATQPGISGDIPPILRSLAVDIQCVADNLLEEPEARRTIEDVQTTLTDIYTIFQTLHEAHVYLEQTEDITQVDGETDTC